MTKPITLDLPEDVAAAAAEAANASGESMEAYFARLVAFDRERRATEAFFTERRARADLGAARNLLSKPRGER